jgi:hypothetical protein
LSSSTSFSPDLVILPLKCVLLVRRGLGRCLLLLGRAHLLQALQLTGDELSKEDGKAQQDNPGACD